MVTPAENGRQYFEGLSVRLIVDLDKSCSDALRIELLLDKFLVRVRYCGVVVVDFQKEFFGESGMILVVGQYMHDLKPEQASGTKRAT